MVLIDGKAETTCLLPVEMVKNNRIITMEGFAVQDGRLNPLQNAFIEEQAAQCGYCTNGMIITAVAMLNEIKRPDRNTLNDHMTRVAVAAPMPVLSVRLKKSQSNQTKSVTDMKKTPISRRDFLIQAGMITIGFSMSTSCHSNGTGKPEEIQSLPPVLEGQFRIDSWLQVLEDGGVRIYTGKMEL
jgi:hypothetical protein